MLKKLVSKVRDSGEDDSYSSSSDEDFESASEDLACQECPTAGVDDAATGYTRFGIRPTFSGGSGSSQHQRAAAVPASGPADQQPASTSGSAPEGEVQVEPPQLVVTFLDPRTGRPITVDKVGGRVC